MQVKIELDLEDAQNVLSAIKSSRDEIKTSCESVRYSDRVLVRKYESLTKAYDSIAESITNLIKGE